MRGEFTEGNIAVYPEDKPQSAVKANAILERYRLPSDCPYYLEGSEATIKDAFKKSLIKIVALLNNWNNTL